MPAIRGITIAVGSWYAKTLAICLPRNMRHLTECLVVTTSEDEEVKAVVASVPGARVFETDAFHRHQARFNKGLAMEEGFSSMGRHGWCAIWDADIVWPDTLPLDLLQPDRLHGVRRKILEDPTRWTPDLDWRGLPMSRDGGPIGYTQIFRFDAPSLQGKPFLYDPTFAHAGGGDAYFMSLFHPGKRIVLPVDTLHLGPVDTNWFGLSQESVDLMAKFVHRNGWLRAKARHSMESVHRAGELIDRVGEVVRREGDRTWYQVPGYAPSDFELPFVQRANRARSLSGR